MIDVHRVDVDREAIGQRLRERGQPIGGAIDDLEPVRRESIDAREPVPAPMGAALEREQPFSAAGVRSEAK